MQHREAILALGQQVDGQEPGCERQVRGMEDGAGDERGLMMAAIALAEPRDSRQLVVLPHSGHNTDIVHKGLMRLVVWRLAPLKNEERPKQLNLNIDDLQIEVHGHQGGSAFHDHAGPGLIRH